MKILLVDSWYDMYKGVILLIRVFEGTLRPGDVVVSFATGKKYTVGEVGIMHPLETASSSLRAGQVGYIYFNPGMKNSSEAKIGDTFTHLGMESAVEPYPGFEEPKPMVFVGAFPVDQSEFNRLDDSINQLVINDRSVTLNKESSEALGQGWRLGFLGQLGTLISNITPNPPPFFFRYQAPCIVLYLRIVCARNTTPPSLLLPPQFPT